MKNTTRKPIKKLKLFRFFILLIILSFVMLISFSYFSKKQGNPNPKELAGSSIPSISSIPTRSSMTPCQQQLSSGTCHKIGQMLIVGFGGLKQEVSEQDSTKSTSAKIIWDDPNGLIFKENSNIAKAIENYHVGGVILFTQALRDKKTKAFIRDRNIQNPEQVQALNKALGQYSEKMAAAHHLPALPLLISVDQEGGMVDRLPPFLGFSSVDFIPQALGANEEKTLEGALQKTEAYANTMADQLKKYGFNTNFFPTVDVNINPLNPIIGGWGRSFSSNPEIVYDQAQVFIKIFNEHNIIPAIKHFPGHGSSTADSHLGLVDVTETYQKDKELLPYRKLIAEGYQGLIMTTHVINGQIDQTQCKKGPIEDRSTWCPGTMSYKTLTTLLREELGFKGVIISDDMTMGAITKEYPLDIALEKAIHAGVDMFIISNNTEDNTALVVDTIAQLVKTGRVTEAEIERAYQHIVEMKTKRLSDSSIQRPPS